MVCLKRIIGPVVDSMVRSSKNMPSEKCDVSLEDEGEKKNIIEFLINVLVIIFSSDPTFF